MALSVVDLPKNVDKKPLLEAAGEVFSYLGFDFEASLGFLPPKKMAGLNKTFLGRSGPAKVLSFLHQEGEPGGDVALCFEMIEKEAQKLGYETGELLLFYLVHGLLHLAGFEHTKKKERDRMEKAEIEILKNIGVSIERN